MLEEPIPATKRALDRAGLRIQDIDLYEVNEAFAPVPLAGFKPSAQTLKSSTSTAAPLHWGIRSARLTPFVGRSTVAGP